MKRNFPPRIMKKNESVFNQAGLTNPNSIKSPTPSSPAPSLDQTPGNDLDMKKEDEKDEKMFIEEKKPDIVVEEELSKKQATNTIDISDEKKDKKSKTETYDIEDTIIRDIKLNGDIHVRLLSNINGYFVDIRKYMRGFPTKKGIRFLASKFAVAADYLKEDLQQLNLLQYK